MENVKSSEILKKDKIIEKGQGIISAVYSFAWLNLICGVIGAIIIWTIMGTKEVPYGCIPGTHTEINHFGVTLGFVSLIQGIFVCALFFNNLFNSRKSY